MFSLLAIPLLVALAFAIGFAVGRASRATVTFRNNRGDSGVVPPEVAALDDAAFHERVQQEIARGRNVTAIQWLRARHGLGLKEAKDAMEAMIPGALERRLEQVRALGEADFQARLLAELAAGDKVEAIRLYRERTGAGHREAKDAVEALGGDAGPSDHPTHWDRL